VKKPKKQTLALQKVTLRDLDDSTLQAAGAGITYTCPMSCPRTCAHTCIKC
jgi:hypothetical protein